MSVSAAEEQTYGVLTYVDCGDYIEITECDENAFGDLIIPESIDGVPVASIGAYAFEDCTSLASVTIPESITSIGVNAFCRCTSLSLIDVAETNENYCSIDGVLFNKNVTTLIGYPAGKNNDEYLIPNSVTRIGYGAFFGCTSLSLITIPDSVTNIEGFAFASCPSLVSITIPDSVMSIGYGTFDSCKSLASVTIPDSVTIILDSAFSYCTSLASVIIPDSVTSIRTWTFANCTSLESITINNPKCYIASDAEIPQSTTIYGYENSTAQTYAEEHGNKFVPITSKVIYGDADGSGDVTLADAVSIVSYIADSERYPLASYNAADVCNRGDGINTSDAISVQNFLLGKITSLPESVITLE